MELVPTREVVRRLRRKQSTISRWVKAGRLTPVVQAGGARGAMFFDAAEVDKVAAELRAEEQRRIESFEATA